MIRWYDTTSFIHELYWTNTRNISLTSQITVHEQIPSRSNTHPSLLPPGHTISLLRSHIFLVLRDHWLFVCLHLKMKFRSCAKGRQWCAIFYYHRWTASLKPRLLFSHSDLVSWGLPFLQFNTPYFPLGHFASRFFIHPGQFSPIVHVSRVPPILSTTVHWHSQKQMI